MARTQPASTFYPTPTEIDPEQAHDEAVGTAPWADTACDVSERNVRTVNVNAHVFHDEGDVTITFREASSSWQIDMTTADARLLADALVLR